TLDIQKKVGVGDGELEGLASIPRQIEGVEIGITMREKEPNVFKISVRANERLVNAAQFCARFGGGGHAAAAGCRIKGTLAEVTAKLRETAEELL
ncbi:MAG: bifunctional oligoribonuclease/PAP phosphatase NrnA, partial [Ruminococcus sp.]|nr:bifunctional oligoribonuclease/PAP phosphatase NrnA [Ruminococcus sp.]